MSKMDTGMTLEHETVLLREAIDGLAIKDNGIYVDGTFGRGGHSREILSQLGEQGLLYAIDRDPQAIEIAKQIDDPRFSVFHGTFSNLPVYAETQGFSGKVDGLLLDLGVSSPQLDDDARGFSFLRDGPLDMRMDNSHGITAAEWLNHADFDEIVRVFKEYGEERYARRIARAIVHDREETPFETTRQLAEMIARVSPSKEKNKHPATRCFQAIRIHINSELEEIERTLEAALEQMAPGGRLSVISFHSLEDRIVKRFIRKHARGVVLPRGLPITNEELDQQLSLEEIGKAIKPSKEEIERNPRSRSSVLRVAARRGIV